MKIKYMMIAILIFSFFPALSSSEDFSGYLILQDIGPYAIEVPQKVVGGFIGGPRGFDGAGVIAPSGHFYLDHIDKTYEAYYEGGNTLPSATVQVTQHPGSDSDQWLLHEISRDFRNYYGLPGNSFSIRMIDGQTVMAAGSGGWDYRWLSGNKVIYIEYNDLQMEKPEPLEIVSAYLTKHPSTLPVMTSADLRTSDNKIQWIKDEMTRRLWLCDKWLAYGQTGGVAISELVRQLVDHLEVFLQYREKYFGVSAKTDLAELDGYKQAGNKAAIETKLAGYKTWWADHKTDSISLP